ncbi:ribosomal protection-like ABC-F family protein [Paenibacillus woosongensis]|uniref:ABC-F type ribosomal protection protein n=1 Tax=Paenibacillus woosongensis TaxID=307580 RepID=A0A7X2Z3A6_9BACL|nr:ABC-F type ribosomal protection protein [Paenibacillus woosongensis]MUG46832.1 ABC-F type ribosomal protection protein [Paenibacillus woosongensis]
MIIQCKSVQKYYGAELVLSDVTFEIKSGERVGLIGRNGTGKTTLMRLLSGSETPDHGSIAVRKDTTFGVLAQIPDYDNRMTVYDVLQSAFEPLLMIQAQMRKLEAEMSALSSAGMNTPNMDRLIQQYGSLQEGFERNGGFEMEASIERVAQGLGIPASSFKRAFSSLSGGEKTKIGLAVILLQQPDVLLLDEPTNHLDMAAVHWLEEFLLAFKGTVTVISHDRYFLDRVADKIIEIEDGEAFTYPCSYSEYKKEKERRLLQQFADYQEQQKKIKKMQEAIKQLIEWGNRSNPPNAGFHRRAASMQKALDRIVKLKRPVLERKRIDLQLSQSDRSGNDVIVLREAGKSIGERTLYRGVNHTLRYGENAALIGRNGAGKTTLMKCILGIEPVQEGEIRLGSRVETGYLAQESAPKDNSCTVLEYFRNELAMEAGEARNQLARFLFYGSDVFKKVHSLSGGEWTRLRLAMLMYRKPNLLLLDEPTNHLDIDSREALEDALEEYPGSVLVISHDRYFINKIADQIWELAGGKMFITEGGYADYQAELNKRKPAANRQSAQAYEFSAARDSALPKLPSSEASPNGKMRNKAEQISGQEHDPSVSSAANPATLRKMEQEISSLEQRIAQIDEAMLDPGIGSDADKLNVLLEERVEIQRTLDPLIDKYISLLEK